MDFEKVQEFIKTIKSCSQGKAQEAALAEISAAVLAMKDEVIASMTREPANDRLVNAMVSAEEQKAKFSALKEIMLLRR